ncbi:MBOAT family O-acyltransferase [Flavobacterium sp.]|uniref:MBOAT family O-acyltransferase n=1 Tax=Flavobacterium sp. TaxID=239 RepID=UPI0025DBC64B|nr:MBOAT family O-acyltransferase [Flavobacterium sp.]
MKFQNIFILVGSYFFYAWADWRFLFFLIGVSALNYFLGIYIEKSENQKVKKTLVYLGLIQGIGGLIYFKYFNFFISSINDFFGMFHSYFSIQTLNIIIPLGISFFTFRTLSYILDIEKGKIKATTDWIVFFNYVAFFPSLLSGPIDKARTFIPQLEKSRSFDFDSASDGLKQILWGLFKKLVIANNCATIVNPIFNNYQNLPSSSLWIGMVLYSVQVYADFSGYSDMAIGVSKLLGFQVSKNFDFPFFAQSIPEYWRKWHISLTSWLTEYVFTPLSIQFRDYDKLGLIIAIVINFVICGIWHGANWTYVLFGLFHGLFFIPSILNGTMNKKKKIIKASIFSTLKQLFNILGTLIPVMFTFVLFKSDTVSKAFGYYGKMFTKSLFSVPTALPFYIVLMVIFFFAIEWFGKNNDYAIKRIFSYSILVRSMFYFFLITAIFIFSAKEQQFIYFQF